MEWTKGVEGKGKGATPQEYDVDMDVMTAWVGRRSIVKTNEPGIAKHPNLSDVG